MKKATLLLVLLAMSFLSAMIGIGPVRASHDAEVTVEPTYYTGGPETKIFNVTNLPESEHWIIEVVVVFPEVDDGDTDYKPVDYDFPADWKARYEPALRQVIFESLKPLDPEPNIEPGEFELFKITFEEGPWNERNYEWIVSTTDSEEIAHTYYPTQTIDRTKPFVIIDYPEDGATVIATWDPYPDNHYFWIEVTAYDEPDISGVSLVEVQLSNETWVSDWVDITGSKTDDTYSIEWYDLYPGWYNVTARAFDGVGNWDDDRNEFEYVLVGVWIEIDPEKGTVGPTTAIDPETELLIGSMYTYGEKTLGTEVTVTGGGFTPNSEVIVSVEHPLHGVAPVAIEETDETGGFTASFLFPTAPHGVYRISAVDDEGFAPLYPALFTVVPEIIYMPAIVVGPAPIEVIATGLPADGDVVGLTCDDTDALLSANWHAMDWYTDVNGTLQTDWADKPGLLMPVLEPGTYEIGLNFDFADEECHVNSISNYLYVVNDFKDLMNAIYELELKLDDIIIPGMIEIKDEVAIIETEVGLIEAKLDDLEPMIVDIKEEVATIETIVGNIEVGVDTLQATVVAIEGKVVTIETTAGDIKGTVTDVEGDVATILIPDVGEIKARVPETLAEDVDDLKEGVIPTPGYLAAGLAAIAAIASIIAVIVVLRRLKVAA